MDVNQNYNIQGHRSACHAMIASIRSPQACTIDVNSINTPVLNTYEFVRD